MASPPRTPSRASNSKRSSQDDPETPPSHYVLASEETPARPTTFQISETPTKQAQEEMPSESSRSFSATSFQDDNLLDVEEEEENFDDEEEALVGRRRRESSEKNKSLFELIPPLILAHPLALLPMLSLLPYNFLPAGVVFYVPIICVLALLSSCAHIVIVYLSWYLKVASFEEIFAKVVGEYGLWAGRAAVMLSVIGMVVGWLETIYPLLLPVIETYVPQADSRILCTTVPALFLLPSLMPSRVTRSLSRAPIVLSLLLPVVAFLIIGRTVEIKKALEGLEKRDAVGLLSGGAGAGLTTLLIFFSPHINTLPIHAQLDRNKRTSFPMPCLVTSVIILVLSLPLSLVPYYLLPALPDPLPKATPTTPAGVFTRLPADDAWVNGARVLMCAVTLGSCNMWILRGRDTLRKALGAGKWVGSGLWAVVVGLACIGGGFAAKIELVGVFATIAIGWLLPAVFFIVTFHVRSPLAIVLNRDQPESADNLLARKERQLQKRRLGRRLWQDLIVYIGILPSGIITMAWTCGSILGFW